LILGVVGDTFLSTARCVVKHTLRVETLKMLDSNPNNLTYQNNTSSNLDKSNGRIELGKEFLNDLEKCPF